MPESRTRRTVGKARAEDLGDITEIEKMCFASDAWSEKTLAEEISGVFARHSNVVRNGEGKAVAYCICRTVLNETQIFKLAVHPLYRRKGLAKTLLCEALKNSNGGEFFLEVATDNTGAISLYSKMGFRKTALRENYYKNSGRDAFVMTMRTEEAEK